MTLSGSSEDICPKCGGRLVVRPARPFPVVTQVLFGVSFLVFLLFSQKLKETGNLKPLLWGWTAVQAGLGILLIRQRMAARKTILVCIQCSQALR
jgi:hypothetical protein